MNPLRWLVAQWNKLEAHMTPEPTPAGEHKHRWRYIVRPTTTDDAFVRQCTVRTCGVVEMDGDIPEGVGIYMDLMSTAGARVHPKAEAEMYRQVAPEGQGRPCLQCKRLLPELTNRELSMREIGLRPGLLEPRRVQVCPYCRETNILEN
jgi:hypothetical protein